MRGTCGAPERENDPTFNLPLECRVSLGFVTKFSLRCCFWNCVISAVCQCWLKDGRIDRYEGRMDDQDRSPSAFLGAFGRLPAARGLTSGLAAPLARGRSPNQTAAAIIYKQ